MVFTNAINWIVVHKCNESIDTHWVFLQKMYDLDLSVLYACRRNKKSIESQFICNPILVIKWACGRRNVLYKLCTAMSSENT